MEENNTGVSDSPQGITETTETTEVAQPTTAQPTEQSEAGASEDSFFDPTTVPEELKPAYKQMQAAFTKKTQEIAKQRQEAEELRQKAEAYDKYSQHIPMIDEMLQKQPQPQRSQELESLRQMYKAEGYSEEAIDMMEKGLGFVLNHFNQSQSQQAEIARVSSGIQEAAKVDPRLSDPSLVYQAGDETVTFGQMVEQLVEADPKWKADPVAATRRAITRLDAMIGTAKTQGKEELSAQAKAKARQFPSTQSSPQSTSEADVKGSIRDIGAQVLKEMSQS